MLVFGIFSFCEFVNGAFVYGSSYSHRDGNEGWFSIRCFGWCHLVGRTWRVYV